MISHTNFLSKEGEHFEVLWILNKT